MPKTDSPSVDRFARGDFVWFEIANGDAPKSRRRGNVVNIDLKNAKAKVDCSGDIFNVPLDQLNHHD